MNEQYIKKLEATNKALEEENKRLEESMIAYKTLRWHLVVSLSACRDLIYQTLKDSPKRNEKTDREFKDFLKALEIKVANKNVTDIDPFSIPSYESIREHIQAAEKKALEVFKKKI